jgi:hypothetical protein
MYVYTLQFIHHSLDVEEIRCTQREGGGGVHNERCWEKLILIYISSPWSLLYVKQLSNAMKHLKNGLTHTHTHKIFLSILIRSFS